MPDNDTFDAWAGGTLELRTHALPSAEHPVFIRDEERGIAKDTWREWPSERLDPASEKQMLENAPVGSDVRWTSSYTKEAARRSQRVPPPPGGFHWFNFQNENAIKVGPDQYYGLGLGLVTAKSLVDMMTDNTRSAVEAMSPVDAGKGGVDLPSNPSDADIREHIFVDRIEYFRWKL